VLIAARANPQWRVKPDQLTLDIKKPDRPFHAATTALGSQDQQAARLQIATMRIKQSEIRAGPEPQAVGIIASACPRPAWLRADWLLLRREFAKPIKAKEAEEGPPIQPSGGLNDRVRGQKKARTCRCEVVPIGIRNQRPQSWNETKPGAENYRSTVSQSDATLT